VPIGELLTRYPGAVSPGSRAWSPVAIFYLATTFALSVRHQDSAIRAGFPRRAAGANSLWRRHPLAGWWADDASPRVLAKGAALTAVVGLVFGAGWPRAHCRWCFLTLAPRCW
jgi:hypothetical protein